MSSTAAVPDSAEPLTANPVAPEHFDVLVVGAGLSGISAGWHLQTKCPAKTFAILEGRQAIGGTWDLFRYPGVRSDSDMHTLGFGFRPWRGARAIADGPAILRYVQDTAREYGIDRRVRFGHRVTRAAWSSVEARWTVDASLADETTTRLTCNFLYACSGYYDYAEGHLPRWPGMERYRGRIVHPQHWPGDLDPAGQRIVVIGSGATAVTLVPALAATAAHVTMLQRSPTYVVSRPSEDAVANWLHRWLPGRLADGAIRWKNVLLGLGFYALAQHRPDATRRAIVRLARRQLGPSHDVERHFTPRYDPWDQRLCLAPDGDLFAALRSGSAAVVTDEIETFTEEGVRLKSGQVLRADLVVTATGLKLQLLGGMRLTVDGVPVDAGASISYKGVMYSDVPNFAAVFGYINASWTLKSDLAAGYVCRLINRMDARGARWCVPRRGAAMGSEPAIRMSSGYFQRASAILPRQGTKKPWRFHQNYLLDLLVLRFGAVDDAALEFGPGTRRAAPLRAHAGKPRGKSS
ncbi:MAG: FAD-containing monooxygenase EthA [Variovorax sp.]|nr:FAD-containing monooxygenase EthA [Variovorax sp.]